MKKISLVTSVGGNVANILLCGFWDATIKKLAPVLIALAVTLAFGCSAWASTLTGTTGTITVANDTGRFYTDGTTQVASVNSNPIYNSFNYVTGGTNQLKFNTSATSGVAANLTGTANVSGAYNGNFWITTNGGRGYNDDIILGVALTGPISNNFALTIQSNGYVVAPNLSGNTTVTSSNWQTNVVNETFTGADFIYGPQATRPITNQPLYNNQGTASGMLMFVDLGVANRTNNQSDQLVFSTQGLFQGDTLAFSAYAYTYSNPNGGVSSPNVIGWTTPTATTGYTVTGYGTDASPTPIPAAVWLFGSGLMGLVGLKRRSRTLVC
jgi:hypothetical protein